MIEEVIARSVGVSYPAINPSEIGNIRISLPDVTTQRAIADYLDAETARIDALIAKKRQLWATLDELVRAKRYTTVTRKNDPTRRQAGWLVDVPASWRVTSLGRIARLHMGTSFPHEFQGLHQGDLPFVKVADLGSIRADGRLDFAGDWVSHSVANDLRARVVPPECVLYARVGAALLLNPRAMNSRASIVDDNVRALEFLGVLPEFGLQVLRLLDLGQLANPGPVPSVSEPQVMSVAFPLPPVAQQEEIVASIRAVEDRTRCTRRALAQQIDLLREHRQALITAAVTGEFQVPGAA